MSKNQVAQLSSRHTGAEAALQSDRCQRQRKWLALVDAFYGEVQQWLAPYVQQGRLRLSISSTSLLARYFGRPVLRTMTIRFAGCKVVLRPVGPLLPGERGWVELVGPRGQARLVPAESSSAAGSRWNIAYWDGTQTVHLELTEDTFLQALLEATSD